MKIYDIYTAESEDKTFRVSAIKRGGSEKMGANNPNELAYITVMPKLVKTMKGSEVAYCLYFFYMPERIDETKLDDIKEDLIQNTLQYLREEEKFLVILPDKNKPSRMINFNRKNWGLFSAW